MVGAALTATTYYLGFKAFSLVGSILTRYIPILGLRSVKIAVVGASVIYSLANTVYEIKRDVTPEESAAIDEMMFPLRDNKRRLNEIMLLILELKSDSYSQKLTDSSADMALVERLETLSILRQKTLTILQRGKI